MKKSMFLLLMISINLHSAALTQRARAYFKIGYGITSLFAGIGAPIMGGYHFLAGKALSKVSYKVQKLNDLFDDELKTRLTELGKSPLLLTVTIGKFNPISLIQKFVKKAQKIAKLGVDSQATLQNVSGQFYLASPLFFIPLGVAAIKSGREDLQKLAAPNPSPSLAMATPATDHPEEHSASDEVADDKSKKPAIVRGKSGSL